MVSLEDGALIDDHDGAPATIRALGAYVTTPEDTNLMAGFSSQGPTHGDLLIKPDVVAPGADIVSSFPQHFCDADDRRRLLGLPRRDLDGDAAPRRGRRRGAWRHPAWTAAQVRSAVVNTAQQDVLRHPETGRRHRRRADRRGGAAGRRGRRRSVRGARSGQPSFGNLSQRVGRQSLVLGR